jgi:hypothetical protein
VCFGWFIFIFWIWRFENWVRVCVIIERETHYHLFIKNLDRGDLEIILKIDGGKWGKRIPSKKAAAIGDCRFSGQKASQTARFHTGCLSWIAAIACGGYPGVRAVPAAAAAAAAAAASPTTATTGGFNSSGTATADAAAASSEGCVS